MLDAYWILNAKDQNQLPSVAHSPASDQQHINLAASSFWINRTVYSFGDSHSGIFSLLPQIQRVPLTAPTAFNIFKIGSTSCSREIILSALKNAKKKPTTVILTFGEIDLRMHVFGQSIQQGKPIKDIIDNVVEEYFSMIYKLKSDGYEVVVNGPHAVGQIQGFPSELMKQLACSYFNFLLCKKCELEQVRYVTLFDKVVDLSSMMKRDYLFRDSNHLKHPNTLIGAELQKLLLDRIESGHCDENSLLYQDGFPLMAGIVLTNINCENTNYPLNCSSIEHALGSFCTNDNYYLILRVFTLATLGSLKIKLRKNVDSNISIHPSVNVYAFGRRHDFLPKSDASCNRLSRVNLEVGNNIFCEEFRCDAFNSCESALSYLAISVSGAKGMHLSSIRIDSVY